MDNERTKHAAVDRPSNIAIARWVSQQAASRRDSEGDVGNYERSCMEAALEALDADPPRVAEALSEAEQGVAHAWRGFYQEDRFEAWACAAVASLLRAA
jgi:hypothetical protein